MEKELRLRQKKIEEETETAKNHEKADNRKPADPQKCCLL